MSYPIYCRACGTFLTPGYIMCPRCGAGSWAFTNDPITAGDVATIAVIGGVLWAWKKITQGIIGPAVEAAVLARARRIVAEIEEMAAACQAGNFKKALDIGRSIAIPADHPPEIEARYKLILGLAQLSSGDARSARTSFKRFTQLMSAQNKSNEAISAGHLLVAEACVKGLTGRSSEDANLVSEGLESMNEVMKRIPPEPDFYALRGLLYCCRGQARPAQRDAEMALELDSRNQLANGVLKLIAMAS